MYIKSIVLEGFKSYGNRVEIKDFDPEFNAITGLNGTGKSNILDSICFVLGITNLGQVRAGSLTELVYKNGQAGITKATVSITFDNKDKSQCPIGYENHNEITVTRQVVMGGKNKYQINGIVVQNKRVNDLFCSVQLNVNNPHFLIMQGRITKVLNMKPVEILSMVEEAAGTRMYEAKKQAAQKTIEKKDAKLRELNDIVKEEIAPKLQKLQNERTQYQEYQKVGRELENLTRLYVAYRYVTAEDNAKEVDAKLQGVRDDIQNKRDTIVSNERENGNLDKAIVELNEKIDKESGSVLKQLEAELQSREKDEAGVSAQHKSLAENVGSHDKRRKMLAKNLVDEEASLASKQATLNKVSSMFEQLRTASEQSAAALSAAQNKFLAVSSGLEGDSASSTSLQDQLMAAKQEASEAATRVTQCNMEKKHCEGRLKGLEKDLGNTSSQFQADQANINTMEREVKKLESELSKLNFSEDRNNELKTACRVLHSTLRSKQGQLDSLARGMQRCNFHYTDPQPNFDRRKVHGTVCRLIDVCDTVYCTALETAAGGRLYNVVVDNETTSKLLLQKGNLQTRTTIIPLNKIHGSVIDRATVQFAQQIGGGADNVQLALDLISYDSVLTPAMQWVFGQTLVCRDLDTAKKVTFHPRVKRRCVTLEGDVFDPSGTLSGGARQEGESMLLRLQEMKSLERHLEHTQSDLARQQAELQGMQRSADLYAATKQKYDLATHELELVKARLATTSHHQLHSEVEELRQKLVQLTGAAEQERTNQREAAARARDLEAKVKDLKGHREREFKKAEDELKKAKKAAESSSKEWKSREQEYETLRLELAELERSVQSTKQQMESDEGTAENMKEQLKEVQDKLKEAKKAVKEIQDKIKKQKSEIASRNSDIARLAQKKESLAKNSADLTLEIKELEFKVKELQTEVGEHTQRIRSLQSENPWIESEKQFFGLAGGLYDFAGRQAGVAGQRIAQLKERRDKLTRGGVNARAHTLLGKEEEQYKELMNKKRIVEQDRAKLVQVMAELDEKKKTTLITACEQVNRDFGSIFSSLLPGAQAKLKPPDGQTVLDGLEVKIGFNNTWKESLGELSGGQRSLVALSLILAMLLFKPAPLYILDEVDAALDLSHTQNIGAMLKDHFRHSQFIIVSLKDGMFNNANVLFRTKFVDGMSTVQRTVSNRVRN